MKYKINEESKFKGSSYITIHIGLNKYRLTENDNKLIINKTSNNEIDKIHILSMYTNQISIS